MAEPAPNWKDKVKEINGKYILDLESQLDDALADARSLKEEVASLKHQNASLTNEVMEWKRKHDKWMQEARDLAKEIQELIKLQRGQ